MDPTSSPTHSKVADSGDDEWDADGFEIPSLNTGKPVSNRKERSQAEKVSRPASEKVKSKPENIYLGPHGAPLRLQEASSPLNRKQRLRQKLKDAEKKGATLGRENKVEVLRDLMGGQPESSAKSSRRWGGSSRIVMKVSLRGQLTRLIGSAVGSFSDKGRIFASVRWRGSFATCSSGKKGERSVAVA